jgi:hypothetical protein
VILRTDRDEVVTAGHSDAYESHVELEIAAIADNAAEATIMGSLLSEAGIRWMTAPGGGGSGVLQTVGRTFYVRKDDLDRAHEILQDLRGNRR